MARVEVDQCVSCGRKRGERHVATMAMPDIEELWDSVVPATDGCEVEPDGVCEHGHNSWLKVLGVM